MEASSIKKRAHVEDICLMTIVAPSRRSRNQQSPDISYGNRSLIYRRTEGITTSTDC